MISKCGKALIIDVSLGEECTGIPYTLLTFFCNLKISKRINNIRVCWLCWREIHNYFEKQCLLSRIKKKIQCTEFKYKITSYYCHGHISLTYIFVISMTSYICELYLLFFDLTFGICFSFNVLGHIPKMLLHNIIQENFQKGKRRHSDNQSLWLTFLTTHP